MGLTETMLHFIENAREGSKFNIMSQSFEYRAWNPDSKFYGKLTELLDDGNVEVCLFGGMPQQEKYKNGLEELYNKGAEIIILKNLPQRMFQCILHQIKEIPHLQIFGGK